MLIVILGLFSTALGVPAPGHGALKGYCINDDHCKKSKCCVSFVLPGETRTDGDDVTRFVNGTCEKLQTKYAPCVVPFDEDDTTPDLHYLHCPCKRKYTCVPNGQTSHVGKLGECRPWCKSSKNCGDDECCVEVDKPGRIKKRRGVCRAMGVQGEACLNINGSGRPSGIVRHSCPCLSQYNCGPIATTDPNRVDTCGFFIG